MGYGQLVDGPDGLDGLGGLDVTTAELPGDARPRTSILDDDGNRGDGGPLGSLSIKLEADDVPFQQPGPRSVAFEQPGGDWRRAVVDAGRWPLVALGVAAILVTVFAAFISRNSQSMRGDEESTDAPSAMEQASAAPAAVGSSGRSTGNLGPDEDAGFFTEPVVEPDRSLTVTGVDRAPTTTPPTKPPTTATTVTTPSTEEPIESSSTTTTTPEPAETTAVPDGPSVRAIGPGTPDEQNPAVLSGRRVTLEAEGSDDGMRYRFVLSVREEGEWRQIDRSGWRSRPEWTVKTKRLEGRTVRWIVIGADRSRDRIVESAPLYFRVGGGVED